MPMNATFALALLLGLSTSLTGCKKRVAITGDEVKNSPEGRACPKEEGLISDGETNSNQIADIKNRGGYWYTFSDDGNTSVTPETGKKGGTFAMSPGGANGTKFAARMSGSVGTQGNTYAGLGLNFVDPKGMYNASKYKGVTFWAKKGPGSTGNVRLKVPDVATEPDGKICTGCYNDFGMDLKLTDDWVQYTIPFTSMKQLKGWGSPHTDGIDSSKLFGMQWQVNEPGAQFDIWIDEIAFTGCGG
jgi:endoglucanase